MIPGTFVPDRDPFPYLLARHRQPLAANVARAYIEEFSAPGGLIVDPFGSSPAVARAALELGRRAVVVDSNPIVAFASSVEARIQSERQVEAALERLGEIPRPDETLQAHIVGQYKTVCARCGGAANADYFVWSRDLKLPVEKVYRCPRCGPGRDAATEADRAQAAAIRPRGFHYHLLLERLSALESPHYNKLRELLDLYTPRNLYALGTLSGKLDVAAPNESDREILLALLLHALDIGSNLYPAPDALPGLKTPDTFVEVNIWQALEEGARALARLAPPLPLSRSPSDVAASSEPAAFVGRGSARALSDKLRGSASLVLTSPSRMAPRFWELSYLWTRWLLGKEASRGLEPFLDEERQRWPWYGNALTGTMREAAGLLADGGHVVAAFSAGSHALIESLAMASSPVLHLDSVAFRPQRGSGAATEFGALRGDYRMVWSTSGSRPMSLTMQEAAVKIRRETLESANRLLAARGEPLAFSWLHHAAIQTLADSETMAATLAAPMHPRDSAFQFLRRELEAGLKEGYSHDLDHWQQPGRVLWIRRQNGAGPLAVRVEGAVREIIRQKHEIGYDDLEDRILPQFPGLLTPEIELIEACAVAYAELLEGRWRVRSEQEGWVESVKAQAAELGGRLGFRVAPGKKSGELTWQEEKIIPASSAGGLAEERVWEEAFVVRFCSHVDLSALLAHAPSAPRGLVILPESEVGLTREKLSRRPEATDSLQEAGWEFLRVPFVERLLISGGVTRGEFQLALGLEPRLEKGQEQMELF